VLSRRPIAIGSNPAATEPAEMRDSNNRPPAVSAKNSPGPKMMASSASVGTNSMTPTTEIVPPTKEPAATMNSTAPARPFLVSL
jgi:hypothetical protein